MKQVGDSRPAMMSRTRRDIRRHGPEMVRTALLCLLLLFLRSGALLAQSPAETPSTGTEAAGGSESVWTGEPIVAPAPGGEPAEPVTPPLVPIPLASVHTDENQQVPVLQYKGEYFDPSGLCSLGPLSEESLQGIRSRMAKTASMGYQCFMLRVDWPAVEPDRDFVDATRLQEMLGYANDLGLKVIISLELSRAPAWFFRGESGSGRVMVSYLVDPEQERAVGNDGDLRWSNGTGTPILYHPETIRAMTGLVHSLVNTLKDEPALLGWYLSGPVTFAFPGGGRQGVVGMCDYSPYTVNRFYEVTGTPLMAYPLLRYSQGTWDRRPEFRAFTQQRLAWKREAFNAVVNAFAEMGDDHLLLVGMDPVLSYRSDNGYLSMIQAPDAARQLRYRGVDGAIVSFRLSSSSFDAVNSRSACSAMHLALTINQILRNGRLAIVLVEPDSQDPPSIQDIAHIAYMIKAAGAYPIWASRLIQKRGHHWTWAEEIAIERAQPLMLLPPPKRLRRGQVAILDLPNLYSCYYAEENQSVALGLVQLAIHQKTGVVLEVISSNEMASPEPVLQQYSSVVYLVPELLTQVEAKSWIDPNAQLELYSFRAMGGTIEAVDQMLLHQYTLEGYSSPELEDSLRTRYIHRGATADLLNGADCFIVANDPYIFLRINSLRGSRWIDVKLTGWPETNLERADFVDTSKPGDGLVGATMVSGNASFKFGPTQNSAHLYVLADDYLPVARPYEARKVGVAISQQTRHMRRSVPAALLLAALLAVTIVWMTFQSQQRSLLQAAELVDRSRRIEPLDILDQPEVRAFYKEFISGPEESEKKATRNSSSGKPTIHLR